MIHNKHIAFIPARKGSVGFKYKNRLFFNRTSEFIDLVKWFDQVIVSTNDHIVKENAQQHDYIVHNRLEELSGPAISIKSVLQNVVQDVMLEPETIIWLFYLPVLYKKLDDFHGAKEIIERDEVKSLCSFIPARTHPYNCWRYNETSRNLEQYFSNDVFRRQDLPPAWMHYHYLCCFKVSELQNLNSELINQNTHPVFLSKDTADQLIEVDTPEDFDKWKAMLAQRGKKI